MKRRMLAISLLFALVVSCTYLGLQVKPYSEMSPKEKVTFLFKFYNAQYNDYKVMAASPNLTEVQKSYLREKKKVLIEVYPIIQSIDLMVVEGKPIDPVIEQKAISLLNKLGMLITK